MESGRPMDRLICGDVGYGKTEVALRAAFKAAGGGQEGRGPGRAASRAPRAVRYGRTEVALRAAFKAAEDGKQVLVLAPTTILAQQHFGTFSERLRDFPFTIGHVSRSEERRVGK